MCEQNYRKKKNNEIFDWHHNWSDKDLNTCHIKMKLNKFTSDSMVVQRIKFVK